MLIQQLSLNLKLLCALAILLTSLTSQAKERWEDDTYIQESFIKIALEREYKETKNPKLVRWTKPIKIYFESDSGDAAFQKELLSVHAQHLSHITGVPIDFTPKANKASIVVVFTQYDNLEEKVRQYIGNPDKIRAALNEAICLGNFRINRFSEITRGTIIIPVDYARLKLRFLDCIVEEITQLMGLPNDSNDVFPSIFNDVSTDSYLSPLDYILLKTLYSPQLKPGMTVKAANAILPNIIASLHDQGEIENAAQRVQQYSLKRYLGE